MAVSRPGTYESKVPGRIRAPRRAHAGRFSQVHTPIPYGDIGVHLLGRERTALSVPSLECYRGSLTRQMRVTVASGRSSPLKERVIHRCRGNLTPLRSSRSGTTKATRRSRSVKADRPADQGAAIPCSR